MDFSNFAADDALAERCHSGENSHEFRSKFERDRDRILYSKAFRRLSGKTQVFVTGKDDHIRTRLTHTLEVAQLSLTIAKQLDLNLPLTEAIAYGHDLGHTPFGHVGERTLNYIMNSCYSIKGFNDNLEDNELGFKHNWQSIRVVNELEVLNRDYYGLNLTSYTLWGILNHSNKEFKDCKRKNNQGICNLNLANKGCSKDGFSLGFYERYEKTFSKNSSSFEALVVEIADEIAQRHHDIEDGIEAGIIDKEELVSKFNDLFSDWFTDKEKNLIETIREEEDSKYYIPLFSKLIVNFLTTNLIKNSKSNLEKISKEKGISSSTEFQKYRKEIFAIDKIEQLINYDTDIQKKDKILQKFMMNRILNSHLAQRMDGKAAYVIRQLFKAYVSNPQQLPNRTIDKIFHDLLSREDYDQLLKDNNQTALNGIFRSKLEKLHYKEYDSDYKTTLMRNICDYISGMTDKYALEQYSLLYES